MGTYTELFEDVSTNIYYDAEDLIEELKKTTDLFRTFDKALDTFITVHGYNGNLKDESEKIGYIISKFNDEKVPVPRNIKKWYSEHKSIERKTAFQICFAFKLSVEEANDFLRRICLFRGFDCHSVNEVVIYFALKQKLSYVKVQDILRKLSVSKQSRITAENVVYTKFIQNDIEQITSEQELIEYLSINESQFEYNNATACTTVKNLWKSIAKKDGIACKEKRQLYYSFDKEQSFMDEKAELNIRKERKRMDDSVWEIYLQILGFSGNCISEFYKNRSIKTILKENELLHPLAEEAFPDRDGLNKILKGEHLSHERVRKIIILLVFYKFWAGKALVQKNYEAGYNDADRCRANIDNFLTEAGYPLLYAGNPYDFIFLYSNNSDAPLLTFRDYMKDLYYLKNEEVQSDCLL